MTTREAFALGLLVAGAGAVLLAAVVLGGWWVGVATLGGLMLGGGVLLAVDTTAPRDDVIVLERGPRDEPA